MLRDVLVCDTDEEALELWSHGPAFCGAAWFAPFGFGSVLNDPERSETLTPQMMVERGMLLVGSVDTVDALARAPARGHAGALAVRVDVQRPGAAREDPALAGAVRREGAARECSSAERLRFKQRQRAQRSVRSSRQQSRFA